MNELNQLLKAIERLQTVYDCNHEVMDADDIGDLLGTIESLKKMYHEAYKRQINQFIDYLETATIDDETAWIKWAEQPYTITHGKQSVTIDNGADVYEALITLLKDHLRDLI